LTILSTTDFKSCSIQRNLVKMCITDDFLCVTFLLLRFWNWACISSVCLRDVQVSATFHFNASKVIVKMINDQSIFIISHGESEISVCNVFVAIFLDLVIYLECVSERCVKLSSLFPFNAWMKLNRSSLSLSHMEKLVFLCVTFLLSPFWNWLCI
jgi:hypothetical protein